MHTYRTRFTALFLALLALVALGACSSDSKSSSSSSSKSSSSTGSSSSAATSGDKDAFCKTNSELNSATSTASDGPSLQKAFKDNEDKLDAALATAPDEVKSDTEKLVAAAKQVAETGDVSPFQSDQSLQTAGQHLDSFCGQSSGSSASGN